MPLGDLKIAYKYMPRFIFSVVVEYIKSVKI
jgi:hypothetical protein